MKLKNNKIKDVEADNPDSNRYNQNKHKGRSLAIELFPEIEKKSFDEYDSLLHAHYALANIKRIKWF